MEGDGRGREGKGGGGRGEGKTGKVRGRVEKEGEEREREGREGMGGEVMVKVNGDYYCMKITKVYFCNVH